MQINEEIRDPEVRLIDENGQQLGIMDVRDAQRLADERELDLVKVSQNVPPTCKLMDYSKYRYDMLKREKEQKRNQKIIEIKEIRLSATIDVHDMEVKAKQESSRKTSISALLTMPKPLTVWITINCGKFFKRWEYQTT